MFEDTLSKRNEVSFRGMHGGFMELILPAATPRVNGGTDHCSILSASHSLISMFTSRPFLRCAQGKEQCARPARTLRTLDSLLSLRGQQKEVLLRALWYSEDSYFSPFSPAAGKPTEICNGTPFTTVCKHKCDIVSYFTHSW